MGVTGSAVIHPEWHTMDTSEVDRPARIADFLHCPAMRFDLFHRRLAIAAAADPLPAHARYIRAVHAVPADGAGDTSHIHDLATLPNPLFCPLPIRALVRQAADNNLAAPNRSLLAA